MLDKLGKSTSNIDVQSVRRVQAVVVTLMVSLSVMSLFDRTIMAIAAPSIIKEFSLSETQMGLVFSAFNFSYALFMIPGGHLADRFGPRIVLTLMGLGAALFTGLTAFSGKPGLGSLIGVVPAFVAIRLGFGLCTAPLYPACGRMNANWVPLERRGFTWGLVAGGVGLGGAISPILFAGMIARSGWRLSFLEAAAGAAALALLWFWYVRDYPGELPVEGNQGSHLVREEPASAAPELSSSTRWLDLLTNRNLMLLTLGYLASGYFQYIFYFWTYYYLGTIRHMGSRAAGLGTTVLFLTVMVTTPLGGWISDHLSERYGRKIGRRVVTVVCMTSAPVFLYVATKLTSNILVGASVAIAMGFAGACEGPIWATAIDIGRREVGAACGILNGGGNVGGFLGPLLTPIIASFAGWTWAVNVACLIAFASALVFLAVDPTKQIAEYPSGGVIAECQNESG